MVEAVARHGYPGTTVRELVALAGVSKSTFYHHFDSKQDCFLATHDEIVRALTARVGTAYRSGGDDLRERLTTSLTSFLSFAEEEPAAARLFAVESLTLGSAGVGHRERAAEAFEVLIRQSFDHSPDERPVSDVAVRAIVAGIRGVAYRRLRADRDSEIPALAKPLVEWAISYQHADAAATARAVAAAERPALKVVTDADGENSKPGWDEAPDTKASRRELTQRERIIRGAARAVIERGYDSLSIPAISGAAGVSNQTFYEHFEGKRDPFLAAYEDLAAGVLRKTAAAVSAAADGPEAIGAGIRALLECIVDDEVFARLAFFELPSAGPMALDRADETLDRFLGFLGPDATPAGIGKAPPPPILEAIGSGAWSVIQHEIAHGRREDLPALAPELTRIVLAPFDQA